MSKYPTTRRVALVQLPLTEETSIAAIREHVPELPEDTHVVWETPNIPAGVVDVLLASNQFKIVPLGYVPWLIWGPFQGGPFNLGLILEASQPHPEQVLS